MMGAALVGYFDRCTGCAICQLACSARVREEYNPRRARLRLDFEPRGLYVQPVVCSQCRNAFCARACLQGAIMRNEDTGALVVETGLCTGCGACVEACPLGVIRLNSDGLADKCDLCAGDPQCVRFCPVGALELLETAGQKGA